MKHYPVFLRLAGRPCTVVGGGAVAERKVESLRAAGARVTVVSPHLTPALRVLAEDGEIDHRAREYRRGDLAGAVLAYAATDDEELHAEIAAEAAAARVLLNVVDRPQWCDFIVPSILSRGDLTVAVSTAGASPALARRVREDIEARLGPEYERALDLLARLRRHLHDRPLSARERQRIFLGLVGSDLLERLREPDARAVDRLLAEHAGEGVSLRVLGAQLD